jgi:hypothetical protein
MFARHRHLVVIAFLTLGASAPGPIPSAHAGTPECKNDPARCACQKPCMNHPGLGQRRSPNLLPGFPEAAHWDLGDHPGQWPATRINFDKNEWKALCAMAVRRWTALSDTLP